MQVRLLPGTLKLLCPSKDMSELLKRAEALNDQLQTKTARSTVWEAGMDGIELKWLRRAWERLEKGAGEVQRLHKAAFGAIPTQDKVNIIERWMANALTDLSDNAESTLDRLREDARVPSVPRAAGTTKTAEWDGSRLVSAPELGIGGTCGSTRRATTSST